MTSNRITFSEPDAWPPGFSGSGSAWLPPGRFTERLGVFEQSGVADSAGFKNLIRLISADLFRTILVLERPVLEELQQANSGPEDASSALRQYGRTLRALGQSLRASLALETPCKSKTSNPDQP